MYHHATVATDRAVHPTMTRMPYQLRADQSLDTPNLLGSCCPSHVLIRTLSLHSIGLGWGVMMRVHAYIFHLLTHAEGTCEFQEGKDDGRQDARPHNHHADQDELCANGCASNTGLAGFIGVRHAPEATPAVVVIHALAPIEETASQHTPNAAEAVHWRGIHRIIDLQLLQQHGRSLIDDATDQACGKSTSTLHVATASRDGHQACKDTVAKATHIVFLRDCILQDKHCDATTGG
mmetsp:Transcript_108316/g.151241  ORF Transcript_108316/g.151241 Transcript_108316/m.151241 type:complete len:235 (-) Transcript_108316:1061-1765(-)